MGAPSPTELELGAGAGAKSTTNPAREIRVSQRTAADVSVRQPIISEADWVAYARRGPWLVLSWLLAAAFLLGMPALVRPHWGAVVAAIPDPLWRFILFVAAPNSALTLVANLFFLVLYAGNFPAVEAMKINKAKPWPWRSEKHAERDAFWALLPWSILRVTINHAFMVPLLIMQYSLYARFGMFNSEVSGFPSVPTMLAQLAVCMVVEDCIFYLVHSSLHHPALYPYIHKVHHEYNHPIALASEHAHPIEFMLGNGLPVIVGPMLTRCHAFTFSMWILIRIATSIDNHCGYAFPLTPVRLLPFGASAEGHDHHHSKNDGMIVSQFSWFDVLYDTVGSYGIAKRKRLGLPVA